MISTVEGLQRSVRDLAADIWTVRTVSCYLNVDGKHRATQADCLRAFGAMASRLSERWRQDDESHRWLQADIEKIGAYIAKYRRQQTRGLAIFSSTLCGRFTAIELAVPLPDSIEVADHPNLIPLIGVITKADRVGVVLADEARTRFFTHELGLLREESARLVQRHSSRDRQRGWNISGSDSATHGASTRWASAGSHVDRHEVALARRDRKARLTEIEEFLRNRRVGVLILAGPERRHIANDLAKKYQSRIRGELSLPVESTVETIRVAVAALVEREESSRQDQIAGQIDDSLARGEALCGVPAVLLGLSRGGVSRLVTSEAIDPSSGYECSACQALYVEAGPCSNCGHHTFPVADVLGIAVNAALRKRIDVSVLGVGHKLRAVGGVAATTRAPIV